MVFNTATVGTAVTPAVISTFLSHYLNRKPRAQKPTAHISYDEGIHLIRKFLIYASHHTVEDIQRFTSQWVPHPHWVRKEEIQIPEEYLLKAAEAIQEQLGHHGIQKVGGKTWWQWRRPGSEMSAEWVEMKEDYNERKAAKEPCKRVMLYVHGGAYFFGSTDEHRYQMQRHARKLKARVFARLAPQFPFPCGLHDCLAAYLYLLTKQDPTTIVLAGDSAGGGMVLSMLVIMRDRGIPLPAGAILISPWVDLTHSFPSVAGDNPLDYIPPHGFHQRPSSSWPPPNSDDILAIEESIVKKLAHNGQASAPMESEADAVQGFHVDHHPEPGTQKDNASSDPHPVGSPIANTVPGPGHDLSIMLDGKLVEIKDQIQMYASNQLISHPLVSPILQPSLGGLPPLLILTGGGEMLRDEQIYLAHKAANPTKYPPGDAFLDEIPHDHNRDLVNKWKPTDVQLQVWEDLCHVAPTLSFTRPAKYMYRSIAQFGAWALARAQKTEIEILDDDDVSVISESESDEETQAETEKRKAAQTADQRQAAGHVGKAGDPLPAFKNHMIRQRVDRHGHIFHLEPTSELPGCNVLTNEIGVIKPGPVKKWMTAKREWDTKYASSKRRIQKQRAKDMAKGYQQFGDGEVPPPSALAGRRKTGEDLKEGKKSKSMGMGLWALWGSKHDEKALKNEQEADKAPETTTASAADGAGARPLHDKETMKGQTLGAGRPEASRSRSRRRTVVDQHQTDDLDSVDENTPAAEILAMNNAQRGEPAPANDPLAPEFASNSTNPAILVRTPTNEAPPNMAGEDTEYDLKRPKAGGIAFPFSLKGHQTTASMTTLTSVVGVPPTKDVRTEGAVNSGVPQNSADVAATETTIAGASEVNDLDKGKGKEQAVESPTVTQEIGNPGATTPNGIGEKVVEDGEIVGAERPPLETFVTAASAFPTLSKET